MCCLHKHSAQKILSLKVVCILHLGFRSLCIPVQGLLFSTKEMDSIFKRILKQNRKLCRICVLFIMFSKVLMQLHLCY